MFRASMGRHELATSSFILEELQRHLCGKTTLSNDQVDEVLKIVSHAGPVVIPVNVDASACRDANDLPILGTVIAARAHVLVTGDKDLLVLEQFGDAMIISPRMFVDRFLGS